MKALRIVLIIVGLLTLIPSVIGLVLPWDRLVSIWDWFGLKLSDSTDANLMAYMIRIVCVTYAWAGFLFLLAAVDLAKYLVLIRSLALASICVGLACILVGARIGLPTKAFLLDGIFCLVAGGLIWTLSSPLGRQCQQAVPPAAPDA